MTATPPDHNGGPPIDWRDYGGFVVEARDARNHPIIGYGRPVKPADPSRGSHSCNEAWRDLLHECRYQDGYVMNGGQKMLVRRGELIGAISWLANRWNWTPKTVRIFLDRLERDGMISRFRSDPDRDTTETYQGNRTGNQASVISVSNYELFNATPEMTRQARGQSNGNQGAVEGQSRGNSNKDKQTNKGTREQESPKNTPAYDERNPPPPTADDLHRLAYEMGSVVKGGAVAKSGRAQIRTVGELDGSHGVQFADGVLTVMNGVKASLQRDYPGIDLCAVCDKAAPDLIKFNHPTVLDAVTVLRKHARWDIERRKDGGKPKTDAIRQMNAIVGVKR